MLNDKVFFEVIKRILYAKTRLSTCVHLKNAYSGHKERSFETDMALVFIGDDCIPGGG